ncbi:MAG: hypothetical protein Q7U35_10875 [Methanobacteriaceae archaeon]|nr:hypothetical protein [Methanobacteriaceae archaeon]MDP2837021.1 hypothetical protein [Methanobacteriaceae archaeon]MDP3034807.1 hypothetical protein [Methanobacteriaceae archaeon]MDP3485787.1 hypothetical protein [Methanobacteriaceae archaeon]MDP3624430.1 hypothetical protein [Methanobacteriaceae archaeon]
MLIKNKKLAIIASILTFIVGAILFTSIILFIGKIPVSALWESKNQLYFFSAILLAAALASLVYGRGSTERATKAVKVLDENLGIEVKKNAMYKILRALEQMPPFVMNQYISMNINAVEEFEDQIKVYKNKIGHEDLLKIRKIIDTPVGELQDVMEKLYTETKLEHFKILAQADAEELITINLQELKKILFVE